MVENLGGRRRFGEARYRWWPDGLPLAASKQTLCLSDGSRVRNEKPPVTGEVESCGRPWRASPSALLCHCFASIDSVSSPWRFSPWLLWVIHSTYGDSLHSMGNEGSVAFPASSEMSPASAGVRADTLVEWRCADIAPCLCGLNERFVSG